jgi:hypothetical protein
MQLPPWCVSTPECRSLAARQTGEQKRLPAAAKAAGRREAREGSELSAPPQASLDKYKRKFSVATRKVPRFAGAKRKEIYRNFSWSGIEFSRGSLKPDWLQIIMTPESQRQMHSKNRFS